MSLVNQLMLCVIIAWAAMTPPAHGEEALLRHPEALKAKVAEIVTPYLHRPADDSSQPQQEEQTSADDEPQKPEPSGKRAWAIVVGVITEDDRQVYGFGQFSATSAQKPDRQTLFEIGSVTKTFTALLLADLVEQGKWKLDDPVRLHLPESVSVPTRNDKEVTLLHLATHTSGLPRIPVSVGLKSLVSNNPYVGYGTQDLYNTLSSTKLASDPGERYAYSNLAFGLLGHMLSRHAEKSYEALVREKICDPLGLEQTCITLSDEQRKRLAPPHNDLGRPSSTWEFDAIAGAGALRSTADDMLTYLAANTGWKESSLLPAMRRCHEARFPAGNKVQSIGLGWHIEEVPGRAPLVFHGGGTGGYNCLVGFVQKDKKPLYGLVVLCNAAPGGAGMVANDVAVKLMAAIRSSEE
jgi:CubicO group peptidase (beta-lactamase class C family)